MAQHTAHASERTEQTQQWTGAQWPRTTHTQRNPPSGHTGEKEPSGLGHCTHSTAHRAGIPVYTSHVAQDTAHATQRTQRPQR